VIEAPLPAGFSIHVPVRGLRPSRMVFAFRGLGALGVGARGLMAVTMTERVGNFQFPVTVATDYCH